MAGQPLMGDLVALFARSVDEFDRRVHAVATGQWTAPTPDTDWDVRALVNHLVNEDLWAPLLLEGRTLAEVGDRFDGDQLGDDPVSTWERVSAAAVVAVGEEGVLDRIVHVSFGDIPGAEYVSQLTCDHVIHAWDLARAVGADERLDPELVAFAYGYLEPEVDGWEHAGVFAPRVDVPADADLQTRLLALSGRRP